MSPSSLEPLFRTLVSWWRLITGSARGSAQSVHGHTLKRPPHQRMLFQHLVETVHAQGVQATVGVGLHGGCASSLGQQADL